MTGVQTCALRSLRVVHVQNDPIMPAEAMEFNGTSIHDEETQKEDESDHEELVEQGRNGHAREHGYDMDEEDEEDEDEDSDDEDDEEPALKYERIGGFMPNLFKKDSAASLAISQKMVSLFVQKWVYLNTIFKGSGYACWLRSYS